MTTVRDCAACPLHEAAERPIERRELLRRVGIGLAALSMLGLASDAAQALSISFARELPREHGDGARERRYPIPTADGAAIDRDNSVIVARVNGRVYAFSLNCPHQNTSLRWDDEDNQFHCPKHKSRYGADGTFIEGRSTRNMDRLAIRQDGAAIVVDVDTLYQEDLNATEWNAAFVAL